MKKLPVNLNFVKYIYFIFFFHFEERERESLNIYFFVGITIKKTFVSV